MLRIMRPKQWIKNTFVLAPLIFSGLFVQAEAVASALAAFIFFSLAASSVYVLNDLRDMEQDRLHPEKSRTRPLANGSLGRRDAIMLMVTLLAATSLSLLWKPAVTAVIAAYVGLNVAYSFSLKHQPVFDLFCIAGGFVLRVYAGAVALDVPISGWMFVTTLSLALYLACIKRRQELATSGNNARAVLKLYSVDLVNRYAEMAATGALIFYSLFVLESHPGMIFTIPVVMFGLFRYWYAVEVRGFGESPTDAVLSDLPLALTVLLWAGLCIWGLWTGA